MANFVATVMVHGKKLYVCSALGAVTSKKVDALLFSSEHAANIASERAGGAGDSEVA